MAGVTVNFEGIGPYRTGDPGGITVKAVSQGLSGQITVRLSVPDLGFSEEKTAELPPFSSVSVSFVMDKGPDRRVLCDAVCEVISGSRVFSRRILAEFLPRYCFDRLSPDLAESVCDAVRSTAVPEDKGLSIYEDISDTYSDIASLKPIPDSRDRYLILSPPDMIMQYGDGTKEDMAAAYLRRMYSKGYLCCLVMSPEGVFVGASNIIRGDSSGSSIPEIYQFVRPSDSCEGIDPTVSSDMSKICLRSFMRTARKGKDYAFLG